MSLNYVRVILIQLFFVFSKGQWKGASTVSFVPFRYPTTSYYPSSRVYPNQYPYSNGPLFYPTTSPSAAATQFLYSPQYSNASAFLQRPSAQQQFFLGPMNAAQAQYLTAYIQKLVQYGRNPPLAPQVQIPSTPALNASIIQPTPPTTIAPFDQVNNTYNASDYSIIKVNTTSIDLQQITNVSSDPINSTDQVSDTNSSDPILGAASLQANPFALNPSYTTGNWLYNPFSSMYESFPSQQPFYPPGYGPWNPFVLNPAKLPVPQSNVTQQPSPAKSDQESNSAATPTIISSTGEGGTAEMENLPPQVKEFIDMIPDILSMPEASQLNPSTNNAVIHQLGGALENVVTPLPAFRKPKSSRRIKKKHSKPLRRRGNYM